MIMIAFENGIVCTEDDKWILTRKIVARNVGWKTTVEGQSTNPTWDNFSST
jgi:hypothetical protein